MAVAAFPAGSREALRLEYRLKQQAKAFRRLVQEPALGTVNLPICHPHTDPSRPIKEPPPSSGQGRAEIEILSGGCSTAACC